MYKIVHKDMVTFRSAKNEGKKLLVNMKGEIVNTKSESDGSPTRYVSQ
jgi:hypothetical protein